MSWWSTLPQLAAAIALLFVPGFLIALASRLRGVGLLAASPLLSMTVISVSAILAEKLGVRWSWLPVALFTVIVAAIAAAVAWLIDRRRPRSQAHQPGLARKLRGYGLALVIGIAIAAVLIGRRMVYIFGQPDSFSQTFDNVFHLNAIRYIMDTGSASSLTIISMTDPTNVGFYPAGWHALTSLVAQLTGGEILPAVNLTNLVIGAVVWPLGCMFLVEQLFGQRAVVLLSAAVLSAAFGAFPFLLIDFGVLYPNYLGNSLIPVMVGLLLWGMKLARVPGPPSVIIWLLILAGMPGISLAHPSSVMAFIAIGVAPALFLWLKAVRSTIVGDRYRWFLLTGQGLLLALGLFGLCKLWEAIRPPAEAASWPPVETSGQAIGEVISSSMIGRPVSWAVMMLALLGLGWHVVKRQRLWLIGSYLTIVSLFVIVASLPKEDFRAFMTGVWYNDPPRLASLVPMVILPMAVWGCVLIWDWLVPRVKTSAGRFVAFRGRRAVPSTTALIMTLGLVAVVALTFSTQRENVRVAAVNASKQYQLTEHSPLLTTDEMAILKRLPENVPQDAILAGNPWNGSALAYAFGHRRTLQLHILSEVSPAAKEIYDDLNRALTDPRVCPAVREAKVTYVLDFGRQEVHGGDHGYRGLGHLAESGVATLVDSQGEAKLYRVTAC